MKNIWALVPLKDLAGAKTRLAGALGVETRQALALAMARDVATALTATRGVARVVFVSDIPQLEKTLGVPGIVRHPGNQGQRGLNEDLGAAALWARDQGADAVLIAHADLPLLTPVAIERFLLPPCPTDTLRLAGCKQGTGTNLLLAPLPLPVPLVFGRDSLARFRAAAQTAGLTCDVRRDPALAVDIDEFDDYRALEARCAQGEFVAGATARLLRENLVLTASPHG